MEVFEEIYWQFEHEQGFHPVLFGFASKFYNGKVSNSFYKLLLFKETFDKFAQLLSSELEKNKVVCARLEAILTANTIGQQVTANINLQYFLAYMIFEPEELKHFEIQEELLNESSYLKTKVAKIKNAPFTVLKKFALQLKQLRARFLRCEDQKIINELQIFERNFKTQF